MSDKTPHIIVYGNYIQEQNIETQNNYYGEKAAQESVDNALSNELLPAFGGNREEVGRFLDAIRNAQPSDITKMVKRLVKDKVIDEGLSHKFLFDILSKHGIYTCSLQNWNKQLI